MRINAARRRRVLGYLCACLALSCASVQFQKDISEYQDEIRELKAKLAVDANDFDALRDLGVIYFETAHYEDALPYLERAREQEPDDAKTMLYLGMTYEFQDELEKALQIHKNYVDVSRLSPYRKLMAGRYHRLSKRLVQQEIRSLLAQEQELSQERLAPKTVAVFPLSYQGTESEYSVLGRGISEMLTVDLGQVRQLTLLERLRLQALIDELKLAQTQYVDPESAPRVGKILGAGRIIAGSFDVAEGERLQLDVVSWDVAGQNYPEGVDKTGELENLFRLEKELVFDILSEMQVDITPEERESIQRVPTQNLQAFLAYCKGLEQSDAGNINAAAQFFQRAAQLDPNFLEAASKIEETQSLSAAGGSPESVVDELIAIEGEQTGLTQDDLLDNRLRNLGTSIGSGFIPGQDSRKPAEEASTDLDLQEPPPPPQDTNRPPQ